MTNPKPTSNENWEKAIRIACTYSDDDGTSGYNLSEKQFKRVFEIVHQVRKEAIKDLKKEVEGMKKKWPNWKEMLYAEFPKEFVGYNQAINDILAKLKREEGK